MPKTELLLLIGEIENSLDALDDIERLYATYLPAFMDAQTRDARDAVMLAEILTNTYTCVETILFRIARVFENHLDAQQWHKALLHKMRVDVPGVRKAVLSPEAYTLLDELRRFRHFRRYYYSLDYDWGRLDYLQTVYEKVRPAIRRDLAAYTGFLQELAKAMED